jgi:hypothetical protein
MGLGFVPIHRPHPACRDGAKDGELAWTEQDFPAPIRLVRMEQEISRRCRRGSPYGDDRWTGRMVRRLGLESTLRPRSRPKKAKKGS